MFTIKVYYDYHLNKEPEYFFNVPYIDIFPSDLVIGTIKYDCNGDAFVAALDISGIRYLSVFLDEKRLYSITFNDV